MNAFGIFLSAVCLRALSGLAERLLHNADRSMPPDWLSRRVHALQKGKKRPTSIFATLAVPSSESVWMITACVLGLIAASFLVWKWDPNIFGIDRKNLPDIYSTLWQVYAQISAIALPILIFVIELSKDHKQAAVRSHEVLVRETFVFPITLFALFGTIRIGIDLTWFSRPGVFVTDLLLFMATIGLTGYAYYSTLRLLFTPARMKEKALEVIRAKMEDSLEESVYRRLANNMLFEKLQELNIGYWPWSGDRRDSEKYTIIDAPQKGTVTDVNMRKLEALVREIQLTRLQTTARPIEPTGPATDAINSPLPDESQDIWIMRKPGDRILKISDGILRIKKGIFSESLLAGLNGRIQDIIRIETANEI